MDDGSSIKTKIIKEKQQYQCKLNHLGISIDKLIEITKQPSFKMPQGLSRENRRQWARSNIT